MPGSTDTVREERFEALELKIMELEINLSLLDDMLLQQGQTIDTLTSRIELLESRLRQAQETSSQSSAASLPDGSVERPPHY